MRWICKARDQKQEESELERAPRVIPYLSHQVINFGVNIRIGLRTGGMVLHEN